MNTSATDAAAGATPAPQLTVKAILLSIILTVILASANAYVGLFAGITVATAIPAAVISMAVLPLFGRPNILENNIVATGASAGTSISAGAIFTLPALILLHHWTNFDYWWTLAIVGLGGLLGVLFSVPLRRTLIIEQKLRFPEGVAAAAVLKVGANPGIGAKFLALASVVGGLFKFITSGLRLLPETFTIKSYFGERGIAFFGYGFSPALLGVGYIVGLNVAILIAAGGLFSWWVAIPLFNSFFFNQDPVLLHKLIGLDAEDAAFAIWRAQVRYIGVGCMLTGALWALWSLRKSLWSAVRSGLNVGARGAAAIPHTERDLPMGAVLICIALFVVPLFFLYYLVVGSIGVALAMAVIMIVAGFLFSSVSGYMAGLVGSSNNPVSGITICTILFASLVLMWMVGGKSSIGAVAVVFIGAVVCNAAAVAGDNLQDLKAGQLVGATPWRQQVMLCVGVVASAAVMAPVMNVLLFAYGIGEPAHAGVKALPAPQANLVRSVAEGMFGGTLPVGMIAIGAAIGALIIVFDLYLKRRGSRWSAPVLAVAVGIYLPLDVSTPILAGGIVAEMVTRWQAKQNVGGDHELLKQNGMLFAAGLITGEALVGIFIAMCIWISKNPDVLAMAKELPGGKWWAALLLLGICYGIFRAGTPRRAV
ncbi:MAG TPA: oligopeptide transporter, OPT family [Steroidobacteraceae bacterium]|nr:oligopeptide transporter, OPT family [Steroidobacteraceae bacterium]